MTEEDAERLLEDLRLLEPMLDDQSTGISGMRRLSVSALLRAMGGVKVAEPRLTHAMRALCYAVRGCYADSNQCELLMQVFETVGVADAHDRAMSALWARAHEALGELKAEMDKFRRRSS